LKSHNREFNNMRVAFLALVAATCIGTALPAAAQSIEVGPGGVGVDLRGPRARDYDRDEYRRVERRRSRDWDETGSVGRCREVTVRERNEYGDRVTRTRRDCR
jgi:hypothetical protein